MKRVLFVDDDPSLLRGLQRMLHPMRREWDVRFAGDGREALNILAESPFDVLVSDMRMPGMDGAQLLDEIIERYPDIVRIVLSGQCNEEAALRSVGSAHQYLSKPCDANTIISTITRACALRDLLGQPSLKKVISQVRALPSLPTIYVELVSMLRSPDTSIRDIGRLIARDVGMSAKILQLVNSAFFGLCQHVSSPDQAVSILGLKTIRALVLSVQLFSRFKRDKLTSFPLEKLSNHSMATGGLARMIALAEKQNQHMVDDVFMAGLLHDTGKLVLAESVAEDYATVLDAARKDGLQLWEAERQILGATHAEVGAYLLGLWGLPDPIVESLAFHHSPSSCVHQEFTPLVAVHVADAFEHEELSGEVDGPIPRIDAAYLETLGLSQRLDAWRQEYRKTFGNGEEKHDR